MSDLQQLITQTEVDDGDDDDIYADNDITIFLARTILNQIGGSHTCQINADTEIIHTTVLKTCF